MPATPSDDRTDQDLLRAYVASRDRESLDAFIGRHEESLVRFVASYLGDETAAQDVVEETFLRVARRPRSVLGAASCRDWLLAVARNLSLDRQRRGAQRHEPNHVPLGLDAQTGATAEPRKAESGRGAARCRVRDEIGKLQWHQRELVLLKLREGKSYREIAAITGLSVTNVGHLVHKAVKTLTARLQDLRESPP